MENHGFPLLTGYPWLTMEIQEPSFGPGNILWGKKIGHENIYLDQKTYFQMLFPWYRDFYAMDAHGMEIFITWISMFNHVRSQKCISSTPNRPFSMIPKP